MAASFATSKHFNHFGCFDSAILTNYTLLRSGMWHSLCLLNLLDTAGRPAGLDGDPKFLDWHDWNDRSLAVGSHCGSGH